MLQIVTRVPLFSKVSARTVRLPNLRVAGRVGPTEHGKFEVCRIAKKIKQEFITEEPWAAPNVGRPDVYITSTNTVVEILASETVAQYKKKIAGYPDGCNLIELKADEVLSMSSRELGELLM